MKQLFIILCALIPSFLWAQNDAKYLEPIPEVNGKIIFNTHINAPSLSQQELFDVVYKWADEKFKPNDKMNARIVYIDKTKGQVVALGEEYIIFKTSTLSLDRTRIYYQLNITCHSEEVDIEMSKIKYWYEEERNGGEKYKAEEWISDKLGLNKSRTKLLPISGKFRRKTIDLKDDLTAQIQNRIANLLLAKDDILDKTPKVTVSSDNSKKKVATAPVNNVNIQEIPNEKIKTDIESKKIDTDNISSREAIINSANRITITSGNDEKFEIGRESWGGFGKLFDKEVTFCLIDSQKTIANMLLSQNEKYTISFFIPGMNDAALTIKCKKMSVQSISGEEANKMNTSNNVSKKYNMYVGEVE